MTTTQGYERFGFLVQPNGDVLYREWAPNALRAYLIGDFNDRAWQERPALDTARLQAQGVFGRTEKDRDMS